MTSSQPIKNKQQIAQNNKNMRLQWENQNIYAGQRSLAKAQERAMEMLARHQSSIESLGNAQDNQARKKSVNTFNLDVTLDNAYKQKQDPYCQRREGNLSMSYNALKPVYANSSIYNNNLTPVNTK